MQIQFISVTRQVGVYLTD